MSNELALPSPSGTLTTGSGFTLPAAIADQGEKVAERFFTFFTDNIPNPNTRDAYYRNAMRFFAWTHRRGLALRAIKSYHVSGLPGRTHADRQAATGQRPDRQAAPRVLKDAVRLADPRAGDRRQPRRRRPRPQARRQEGQNARAQSRRGAATARQ